MKFSISILTGLIIAMISLSSFSKIEDVTTSFRVNGNCGTCKRKIETALRIKGIKKVNWDIKSHDLTVTFNPDKITLDEIHHRIAAAGYDTDKVKATDDSYAKLDECCKYDRDKN